MNPLLLTLPLLLLTACGGGSNDEGENPGDCSDNIDNDSDGQTDCFDAGCSQTVACLEDALTGEKGDKGDQGEQGEPGPQGEPGEPGADGVSKATQLNLSHNENEELCFDDKTPRSDCCPFGFSPMGTNSERGHTTTVCIEDTPTSRIVIHLEWDLNGNRCSDLSDPALCCPSDFTFAGWVNGTGNVVACLQN